jgi:peroxiredoxin/glutaredoxin
MKPLQIGDRVPSVTFRTQDENGWRDVDSASIFDGRTVIVFSLPGAFTPTCSGSQVPGYDRLAPLFKARGVDEVACISVNDAFVMNAWQRAQRASNIRFLPDGNGEFTAGMGMLVEKRDLGFGVRSWRYSMLVRDGIIEQLFVEPEEPGDPYGVSSPETMMEALDGGAKVPSSVVVLTKPGCQHCTRAKALLRDALLPFDELSVPDTYTLYGLSGRKTTPQIFIDGQRIGGTEELERLLNRPASRAA